VSNCEFLLGGFIFSRAGRERKDLAHSARRKAENTEKD
jgi:hypothetical protein